MPTYDYKCEKCGHEFEKMFEYFPRLVLANFVVIYNTNSKLEGVCSSNLAESDGMGN